ncbi:class I SAM-dependent methyltransferase [Sphingomonas sp. SUN039]|uniref:class I SAM-dependent methyltransferase n=1 Tax=Sphingomonas sp. SUN039 TaxID=2937787 RepID=UPI0021648416|nr:class I SAM-dependent methyltransferase [Sphingomonas sp. SUN039]UVO53461.1 class I SAM-dependent methyltransferase [Sphingomonas sp. SUN039]
MTSPPPVIFDRVARRLRRDRVACSEPSPLEAGIARELLERLDAVTRPFATALVINTGPRIVATALRERGIAVTETDHGVVYAAAASGNFCDEDRLDVASGLYDLVVMPSGLDTVDDVPGALIAARRALRDDGLFLACLIGSPSLPVLRDVASAVDAAQGRAVARLHPQIDVRAAGDLLVRAGFALPVADAETLRLSYPSFDRLVGDIRAAGLGNVLAERRGVSPGWLAAARAAFERSGGADGRAIETVTLLILTGWAAAAKT